MSVQRLYSAASVASPPADLRLAAPESSGRGPSRGDNVPALSARLWALEINRRLEQQARHISQAATV